MTDVDDYRDYDDYEPSEPDFDAIAEEEYWAHCDEAHDGQPCTCPKPADSAWDEWMSQHEAEAHGGKPCKCPEYTEPPF